MKVSFACPSCGVSGSVDESFAGRQVRCNQCQYRFPIPAPGSVEPDGYALDAPEPKESTFAPMSTDRPTESVFAPTLSDEPEDKFRRRSARRLTPPSRKPKRRESGGFGWRTWLIRVGIAAVVVLFLIAVIAPGGVVIVGRVLLIAGMGMVILGWGAGAFGAFSEDLLYGLLYVLIPLYTAYYLVTRWDDLWRWFACSTTGVGLVVVGTEILRWSGVEA
jgi:hypothetical protein